MILIISFILSMYPFLKSLLRELHTPVKIFSLQPLDITLEANVSKLSELRESQYIRDKLALQMEDA